jgi:response regulator RpfG family c-di-GMP phosphodiesterase
MKVLIVDDAALNLRIYERVLGTIPDLEVHSFAVSKDALKWLETAEPDLAIVDYKMPQPDGLEFVERFRTMPGRAEIPIVMLTAERDAAVRRRALELGANDFLNKPADPIEFVARARNLLALRKSRKELAQRALRLADEVRAATAEIAAREQETIHRLTRAAEFRDNETGMHIVRMGRYSAILGGAIGLDASEQELLQLAAPMHDIGKVAIPDQILLKPGKLTADEWDIMKTHTSAGFEILRDSKSRLLQQAAEIALTHHERWDGSGYPRGLSGDAIPVSGRICAISDVFDALTSVRPYKPAWPVARAVIEIEQQRGRHFDPVLVEAFGRVLGDLERIRRTLADTEAVPA